jgi:type I restriction enzyme S subunit
MTTRSLARSNSIAGWSWVPFDEAFRDVTGGQPKLQNRDYAASGAYPVIDQGATFIGGYTDNKMLVADVRLPAILFGDHTKAFKWVENPFVLGADGVKIIEPLDSLDRRFAFHYLRTVRLPQDAGYSRHFKFLKRTSVPIPPLLDEQRRIAAILDKADSIRQKWQQALTGTNVLQRAIFLEMFGDPVANPRAYDVVPLERLIHPDRPITYGILMPGPDVPGGIPYVRVVDMQAGRITLDQVRHTSGEIDREYRRSRLRAGDLLLSIRGHVGRTAVVPAELDGANITQDTARLAAESAADGIFLRGCIDTAGMQRRMGRLTKGGAVKGINLVDVRRLPVPLPPPGHRARFAEICQNIERVIRRQRDAQAESENLFASLTQRAFRGELQ